MAEAATKQVGWPRVAFGDVVRKVTDRVDPEASGLERYVAGEHMDTDDLRIRRWGTIGDGYLGPAFHMRFKPGHVLYGSRRTYLRKVAVPDFEGITANTTFVLEPKDPDVLLPELLPFLMQTESFQEHSVKQSKGSVNPYVNFSDLAWYEFALPPLEEQRRIAEAILQVDTATESQIRLADSLSAAESSVFEALTKVDPPQNLPLGDLLLAPPRNGHSATEKSETTGHWVLSLSAITKHGYQRGQLKAVEPTSDILAARIAFGDLVISRSNTLELVGLPAIFEEDRDDVSRPDTMMLLEPDDARLRPRYLELFLRSPSGRQQVRSYAAGTSGSMKKINGRNVQKLLVPIPSIETQRRIECAADAVKDGSKQAYKRAEACRHLKSRILHELL